MFSLCDIAVIYPQGHSIDEQISLVHGLIMSFNDKHRLLHIMTVVINSWQPYICHILSFLHNDYFRSIDL